MNIEISGRHFDLTDALKQHVERKLDTIDRFYDGILNIHVILEVTSGTNHVHIQVRGNHIKLDSKAKSHDIYSAFDEAFDTLEHRVRKFKDKMHNHRKNHDSNGDSLSFYVAAEESELDDGILIDDSSVIPRLDTEEAIVNFEIEPEKQFVFQNNETGKLSVVYSTSKGKTQVVELVREQK
ncbi:MAG: ribosome-associated translation inhibitor RaiA [Candidatus Fermentibacteraceae bacterium]|nr:ribosome-associated translation inhibitor RaiA [Candidatus Fermentibacteraceae bacterium]MBN2607636.1 ribosome-associated translation inhibitor RaiA [Candidatus Fermentibacteraceae bacterium]